MRLEDLKTEVGNDLQFDKSNMGGEAVRVSQLFTKYSTLYLDERMVLRSIEEKIKSLRARKVKLARQAVPTAEITDEEKASFLLSGVMLKGPDFDTYIDDEPDLVSYRSRLAIQQEKVSFLKEVLEHIKFRSNQIKHFIDWERFKAGDHVA